MAGESRKAEKFNSSSARSEEGAVEGRDASRAAAAAEGKWQGKGMLKRAQIDTEREWRAPVDTRRPPPPLLLLLACVRVQ